MPSHLANFPVCYYSPDTNGRLVCVFFPVFLPSHNGLHFERFSSEPLRGHFHCYTCSRRIRHHAWAGMQRVPVY
jgi:hypothetical protein